jgi:uncharacterized protein
MKNLSALLIGMIFGFGIAISGMINPSKVLNFFDLTGMWDPSLMFVIGGALVTTMIGYSLVFGLRRSPVFNAKFSVPTLQSLDRGLVGGSALFGVGWGMAGFCPGGAIPALSLGHADTLIFVVSMIGGMYLARQGLHRNKREL